jgi:hypothetical protein
MSNSNDQAPPDVQEAARKVQGWLDRQQQATQPRPERAVDRFARMPRSDVPPKMPDWKDPRGAA